MTIKLIENIDSINKVLTFIRELVIIVVVALTLVIIYLGGNPNNLNYLNWAELVFSSLSIILFPILAYIIAINLYRFTKQAIFLIISIFNTKSRIPRDMFTHIAKYFGCKYLKRYIKSYRKSQKIINNKKIKYTRVTAFLHKAFKFVYKHRIEDFLEKDYKAESFILALMAIIYGVSIFYKTLSAYIPGNG